MFTGIVEALGTVTNVIDDPPGKRLVLAAEMIAQDAKIGDSIAVNGCCLTAVSLDGVEIGFDVGPETLSRTNLGFAAPGRRVNLERSLKLDDRLGGHLVTGHIDGLGYLAARKDEGTWSWFRFRAPIELLPQMASKGSIAVDGVSLTLVDIYDDGFSVAVIPHTLAVTTLGELAVEATVNLETDLLAKYVQRQLACHL
jgi:riboflavin synthase